MHRVALYGTALVILATMIEVLHTVSHAGQNVMSLPAWQLAYVTVAYYFVPIAAAVLLWSGFRWAGAWLLLASMAASFVFGLAFHFIVPGRTKSSRWSRRRGGRYSRFRPRSFWQSTGSGAWSVCGR